MRKREFWELSQCHVQALIGALPEYILCANGQVLRLRKKRKILQIPHFHSLSKEHKYARTLLYFPLAPGQVIDIERIGLYIFFI